MNIDEARQLFESAVRAVLKGTAMGSGQGTIYDSVDKFLDEINDDTSKMYVEAIEHLQEQRLVLYEDLLEDFRSQTTLKAQVRMYIRELLIQEAMKALRLSPRSDGSVKMGQ